MAKRKTTFRVEARGDQFAALSPEGEDLGTFGSQRQAEEYASSYAEVFNILAQDTGQAVRFGTQKAESPEEKQQRIKQQAADAARQFAQAAENVKDPTFGVPTGTPGTLTKGANLGAQSQLAQQAAGPPPTLAQGKATGEGLTAADVRRIIRQEQKRQPKPRRSLAANMEGGPTPPPHSKPQRQRKKSARKPRRTAGGGRVPMPSTEMGAGGFVLEDAPTTLTAFDVSRMLSGQPPSATPSLTSTLDYPAGQGSLTRAAATTPAAPVLSTPTPTTAPASPQGSGIWRAQATNLQVAPSPLTSPTGREVLPGQGLAPALTTRVNDPLTSTIGTGPAPTTIPGVAAPPTKTPRSRGAGKPPRPPRRPRSTAGAAPGPAGQPAKQNAQQKGDDYRKLAEAIGQIRGKQLAEAVGDLLSGMTSIFRDLGRQRQQTDDTGRPAQRERQDEEKKRRANRETRTSNRLLEASQKQLKSIFKPLGNALENFRKVGRARLNNRIGDLAKRLGLDKLTKGLERDSRAFAARIARGGGGRGLLGSAARGFVPGLAGRVGLGAGRAGAAGVGAGGAAAEAGAGGMLGAAGAVVGTELGATLVGAAAGAALFSAGLALATKAAVDFTKHTKSAGRERLESQREFARLNAGIATTFANLDRATFLRDFQRAAQTSASVDLLGRSQVRLQNDTAGFGTAAQTLHNVFRSTLNDVVAAALERSGLAQFGQVAAMLADLYARWRGRNPGPVGHPALRFLDDVAKGNFKSPPAPKNKAPQKPGKI